MRPRLLLLAAVALITAASFTTTASAATAGPVSVTLKPKKVKASGKLTPKPFTVPATGRLTIHTDGSLTFSANRKRVRLTDIELGVDPLAVVVTGKIGGAVHPLFLGRGAIAIDPQTGAVSSSAIKLGILSSARAAINKSLGFKRGAGMSGGKIGSIAFNIPGTPPPVPVVPTPPPPAIVDTTAPTVTIDLDPGTIRSATHPISFTVSEPASTKCSVDGATPVACTSPYAATGLTNGNHTVSVTATDAAGNVGTDSVPFTVELTVELCGTLSADRVLTPTEAHVYLVTCDLVVPAGVDLTVAANTIVKFAPGKKIEVDGELFADGGASQTILFVSAADDGTGGDTNGDGSATTPQPGDWGGIVTRSGSNSTISIASAQIKHATEGVSARKLATDDAEFYVHDNYFADITGAGVEYLVEGSGTLAMPAPEISGNDFDATVQSVSPLSVQSPRIDQALLGDNFGQSSHSMLLAGTLVGDGPIPGLTMTVAAGGLTVAEGSTFEIGPGALFKFRPNKSLIVDGSLDVAGALGDPVRFTSARSSTGGQTPWSTGAPAAGDWVGIVARTGTNSSLDLDHFEIDYAHTGIASTKLTTDYAPFDVSNAYMRDIEQSGISYLMGAGAATSPAPRIATVQSEDGGGPAATIEAPNIDQTKLTSISGNSGGDLHLAGNLIGDGSFGSTMQTAIADDLEVAAGAELSVGPSHQLRFTQGSALTVNGTLTSSGGGGGVAMFTSASQSPAAGDWKGIEVGTAPGATIGLDHAMIRFAENGVVRKAASSGGEFSVTDSEFEELVGAGVKYTAAAGDAATDPPTIHTNAFTNIGPDAVVIDAPNIDQTRLSASNPGLRITGRLVGNGGFSSGTWANVGDLEIAAGAELLLGPYGTLRFAMGSKMLVNGTLTANGVPGQGVELRSASQSPAAGDWDGVEVGTAPGATVDLQYTEISDAVNGVVRKAASSGGEFKIDRSWLTNMSEAGVKYSVAASDATTDPPMVTNSYFGTIGTDAISLNAPNIDQTLLGPNSSDGGAPPVRFVGTMIGVGAIPGASAIKKVIGGLTVAPGAQLVLERSDLWFADAYKSLIVKGGVLVTSPLPLGYMTIQGTGGPRWNGVVVDGGTLSGDYLTVQGAMTGISYLNGGGGTLTNSTVDNTVTAIDVRGGSHPTFSGSITNSQSGVVTDGSSTIDARNTWWGAADGPAPIGSGVAVEGNVNFTPWLVLSP